MTTITTASSEPAPRRSLAPPVRILVWIVRLVLLLSLIKVARNPWPLLRSRVFPALLMWIAFSVYWGIAARNSSRARSSESGASAWFHQVVLTLALVLLFAPVPGLIGWFLPQKLGYLVATGVTIQVAFILLAIWARRCLGSNWSAAVRIGVDHQLVRTGPYRLLRHPIYTAMLGMFLGTAISSSQYHALLGLVILVFAYLRKTRMEERLLEQTFGAEYDAYRCDTWALVPFLF